jgi:hypothetical protein
MSIPAGLPGKASQISTGKEVGGGEGDKWAESWLVGGPWQKKGGATCSPMGSLTIPLSLADPSMVLNVYMETAATVYKVSQSHC